MKTLLAVLLLTSLASAQWIPTVHDVEAFFDRVHAHIERVQEQQAFDARAKHVGTRERLAKAKIKRIDSRYRKVEKKTERWLKEIEGRSGLDRRLRTLRNKSRSVRGSTMKRNLSTLVETVKRKIAQREDWIKRADQERLDLNEARLQALSTLEESALIRVRLARDASPRQ